MKLVRLSGFVLGLLVFIGCIVLLLNVTAPNPTGRRYSSRGPFMPPELTNDVTVNNRAGADAEAVLEKDLGVTNNNASGQRQCLCQDVKNQPKNCDVCVIRNKSFGSDRIPDFITDRYIAESKNTKTLDQGVAGQLQDYASAAKDLKRPLWIFVRVNTEVDPGFKQLAEDTNGGVTYYFTYDGYLDPVDQGACGGLVGSGALVIGVIIWEVRLRRRRVAHEICVQPTSTKPPQQDTADSSKTPKRPNPIGDTLDALNRAEDAAKDTRNRLD